MIAKELINEAEKLKKAFSMASKKQIVFDGHYYERASIRPMPKEEEIIENILNPIRLAAAEKQAFNRWRCYFTYSRTQAHVYIIVITVNNQIKLKTAWILNRDWRRELNARSRKRV